MHMTLGVKLLVFQGIHMRVIRPIAPDQDHFVTGLWSADNRGKVKPAEKPL